MNKFLVICVILLSTSCVLLGKGPTSRKTLQNGIEVLALNLDDACEKIIFNLLIQTSAKNFAFRMNVDSDSPRDIQFYISRFAAFLSEKDEQWDQASRIAIVVVGDCDPNAIVEQIDEQLSSIPLELRTEQPPALVIESFPINAVAIHISYSPPIPPIKTQEDLEAAWKLLVLEQLGQQRQIRFAKEHNIDWVVPGMNRTIFPPKGYIFLEQRTLSAIKKLSLELSNDFAALQNEKSFVSEIEEIKKDFLARLHEFHNTKKDILVLSSFLCDQIFSGWAWFDDESFVTSSLAIVEALDAEELSETARDFFVLENMRVAILLPNESDFSHATFNPQSNSSAIQVANSDALNTYLSLPMDKKKQKDTYDIIHAMGTKSKAWLLMHAITLNRKGDHISGVHPMRFIGFILADPVLKADLNAFHHDKFKWHRFINEFSKSMNEQMHKHTVHQYLEGFAEFLHVPCSAIQPYFDHHKWEDLVIFLMNH